MLRHLLWQTLGGHQFGEGGWHASWTGARLASSFDRNAMHAEFADVCLVECLICGSSNDCRKVIVMLVYNTDTAGTTLLKAAGFLELKIGALRLQVGILACELMKAFLAMMYIHKQDLTFKSARRYCHSAIEVDKPNPMHGNRIGPFSKRTNIL